MRALQAKKEALPLPAASQSCTATLGGKSLMERTVAQTLRPVYRMDTGSSVGGYLQLN